MVERVKQIPTKLLEFWNKYTSKQKTIIISVIVVVVIAIAALTMFLTKTQYKYFMSFEDTKGSNELIKLLEGSDIQYQLSKDGKTIYVEEGKTTEALLLTGENDIPKSGMSWTDALTNDMSTTEKEKNKKMELAFQNDMRSYLKSVDGVKDASVVISAPEDDTTILTEKRETSVSVILDLTEELSDSAIKGMATYLYTAVGNTSADKVTIIDSAGNLLFGGDAEGTLTGKISGIAEYKEKLSKIISNNVMEVLLQYGYNDVKIGSSNIVYNTDQVNELYTEYTPAEGQEQGVKDSDYSYKTNSNSGSGGIPGTDSNADDTDYMITDGGNTSQETTLDKNNYLPNKRETTTTYGTGAVKPKESSMAIVLKKYKIYNEEDLETSGELSGMTFEQFRLANSDTTPLTVDEQVLDLVSKTTGIDTTNLSVVAFEQPIFNEKAQEEAPLNTYLMIFLIVAIVALLIFVIFKGTAPVEVTEQEPELSVEQLLATTKDNQSLDDIEFDDKSETRKMIEKFVDENPEAVAQLLRNWLNEDWG